MNPFVIIFAKLVKEGRRTIEQVPAELREEVITLLETENA